MTWYDCSEEAIPQINRTNVGRNRHLLRPCKVSPISSSSAQTMKWSRMQPRLHLSSDMNLGSQREQDKWSPASGRSKNAAKHLTAWQFHTIYHNSAWYGFKRMAGTLQTPVSSPHHKLWLILLQGAIMPSARSHERSDSNSRHSSSQPFEANLT